MDFTSFSVRVWKEQLKIIEKAAEKFGAKTNEEISVAEYVRRRLMPHAFADSGTPVRDFPPFIRGPKGLSSRVAAKLGMPRQAWEKAILERAAVAALKELNDDDEEEEPDRPPVRSDVKALAPPVGAPIVRRRKST